VRSFFFFAMTSTMPANQQYAKSISCSRSAETQPQPRIDPHPTTTTTTTTTTPNPLKVNNKPSMKSSCRSSVASRRSAIMPCVTVSPKTLEAHVQHSNIHRHASPRTASTQTALSCAPLKSSVQRASSWKLTSGLTVSEAPEQHVQSAPNLLDVHLARVDLHNAAPRLLVGQREFDLAVKAA
jgi:hypothetical protein